jgi:hypothetical protein
MKLKLFFKKSFGKRASSCYETYGYEDEMSIMLFLFFFFFFSFSFILLFS